MNTPLRLTVVPAEGVTASYAAASGDDNPIHLNEDFARSVGLEGRILHGLWTMAQVARAATSAAPGPVATPGGGYKLHSLTASFRGMGRIGPEIVIDGSVDETGAVSLTALQGSTRLIRGAQAQLRLGEAP